ncbi:MAG: hypothetical protein GIX03_14690 [Candidatus Eremiobacteraeota bacterium]|nr:hypothetical protein [Candidatus Eremiobacteraeota bacterium]MBC5804214.1 hypothetical protein [Candidatus Eremiobacteraeota bacterium]MBC5822586.1 hypothetical protein [Candidatus Eremiobacteraeota bacterium]
MRVHRRKRPARPHVGRGAVRDVATSTVAYPIGVDFDKVYTAYPGAVDFISAGNATGLPAIGLPHGFGVQGLLLAEDFCPS